MALGICLVTAILQFLSVVKLLRYFLDEFDSDVFYKSRFVVYGSVIFWLLASVAICICGVKQRDIVFSHDISREDFETGGKAVQGELLNVTVEHDELDELEIVGSFSGEEAKKGKPNDDALFGALDMLAEP